MNTPRSILMLLATAVFLPACEKNDAIELSGPPEGGAFVKFYNFSVGAPGVNFYRGDTKINGISVTTCQTITDQNREQCTTTGAESGSGVAYGSTAHGTGGYYSDTPVGQQTFTAKLAADSTKNVTIASFQANLVQGKFYSLYLSGIYDPATRSAEAFIVEDVLPPLPLDVTKAYVRFVNASSTSAPVTLYAKDRVSLVEVPIGGEVAYKAAGAFVAIPPTAYDLSTKLAGGAAGPFTRTSVSFGAGRVYTITARGNTTVSTTLALDNTANR